MKITSICQPHFFPWVGYFNMINNSDDFIFLDNVQYNRKSWQNRTYIQENKSGEKKWLSMSLLQSSRSLKINEVYISNDNLHHLKNQLYENYKKTKYFDKYFEIFVSIFSKNLNNNISKINIEIIKEICVILNIKLNYKLSSSFEIKEKKQDLILKLLQQNKSSHFIANTGSLNYIDENFFKINNIIMKPHNYIQTNYYQYRRDKEKKFLEGLSILDMIFNIGEEASLIAKKHKVIFNEKNN